MPRRCPANTISVLIVAAARRLRAKLVSRDAVIEASGLVETIWA